MNGYIVDQLPVARLERSAPVARNMRWLLETLPSDSSSFGGYPSLVSDVEGLRGIVTNFSV